MNKKALMLSAVAALVVISGSAMTYFVGHGAIADHFATSLRIADSSHALAAALVPGETYPGGRIRFVMARGNLEQVEKLIAAEEQSHASVTSFPATLFIGEDLKRCIGVLHTAMELQLTVLKGLHEDSTSAIRSIQQYADADRYTYTVLDSCAKAAKAQ